MTSQLRIDIGLSKLEPTESLYYHCPETLEQARNRLGFLQKAYLQILSEMQPKEESYILEGANSSPLIKNANSAILLRAFA